MAGVRMVVTGGFGFVGSAIVTALIDHFPNCDIVILDKATSPTRHAKTAGVKSIQVDLTFATEVKSAFEEARPDFVIHTAGYVPPLSKRYSRVLEKVTKDINVAGTRHVLDAAVAVGCRGMVYTSSCCAVTDDLKDYTNIDERWPLMTQGLVYGESKVEAEKMVMAANSDTFGTCVLRPAVIFGEGDYQLVPSIYACIDKGQTPFRLGEANNMWDTVYVDNVAHAHALAARNLLSTKTAGGEVFFIQNNEPITFREFSLAIWKEFDHYPPFEFEVSHSLGYMLGILAECWSMLSGTPTTVSRGSVSDACATRFASGAKAERILGYEPLVGLEEALKRSCKEYKERLDTSTMIPRTSRC